jgi:glycosyltransferase involved in cell wall biosynthesis
MPSNNNSQPLISVVIPVFKSANKLPVTLDSLFAQGDLSLWEAIVRDGSPDSSVGRQVVEQFLVKNPTANIQFIDGPDKGVYDAMNQGIEASAGKFLYFAGSGDTVLDGVFDKISGELQESLRKNKFCVVYGSWEHSDAKQLKGHEYTWMDFARKRNINHFFFTRDIR